MLEIKTDRALRRRHGARRPAFAVDEGRVCGLIGPNGAGKTTLFNCVSRLYTPESGAIRFDGEDLLRAPAAPDRRRSASPAPSRTSALVPALTRARERAARRPPPRARRLRQRGAGAARRARRRSASCARRPTRCSSASSSHDVADRPAAGPALRDAQADRAGARAVPAAAPADARRAGQRPHPRARSTSSATLIVALRDEFDLTVLLVEHHMGMVMRVCEQRRRARLRPQDRRGRAARGAATTRR